MIENILFLCLLALAGIWLLYMYNQFVAYRNALKQAWADLDTLLNNRYSVLWNYMEMVKGYAGHENNVLNEVTETRSKAMHTSDPQEKSTQDAKLSDGLFRVFGLVEAYPDLKADQRFRSLEEQLVTLEKDIQIGRAFYNRMVKEVRNYRDRFPIIIAAWLLFFPCPRYFAVPDHKKQEFTADFSDLKS